MKESRQYANLSRVFANTEFETQPCVQSKGSQSKTVKYLCILVSIDL